MMTGVRFLLLAVICFFVKQSEGKCSLDNAYEFSGSCYFGEKHQLANYTFSKQLCQLHNADLVTIKSQAEQDFLTSKFTATVYYLNLQNVEGEWKWPDGTSLHFANWDDDEPLSEYSCAVVSLWNTGKWASQKCGALGILSGYVCKMPTAESGAPVSAANRRGGCRNLLRFAEDNGLREGFPLFSAIVGVLTDSSYLIPRNDRSELVNIAYTISELVHGKNLSWVTLEEIKTIIDDFCDTKTGTEKKHYCDVLLAAPISNWGTVRDFVQCIFRGEQSFTGEDYEDIGLTTVYQTTGAEQTTILRAKSSPGEIKTATSTESVISTVGPSSFTTTLSFRLIQREDPGAKLSSGEVSPTDLLVPDYNATKIGGIVYALENICSCNCAICVRDARRKVDSMIDRVIEVLDSDAFDYSEKKLRVATEVKSLTEKFGTESQMYHRIMTWPISSLGTVSDFLGCAFGCSSNLLCDSLKTIS